MSLCQIIQQEELIQRTYLVFFFNPSTSFQQFRALMGLFWQQNDHNVMAEGWCIVTQYG